jgi:ankyrin repeat protein
MEKVLIQIKILFITNTKKLKIGSHEYIAFLIHKYNLKMDFSSIETLSDLIASETSKGNTEFVNKLIKLGLSNKTSIQEAIKHCIDNNIIDLIELVMLPSYKIRIDSSSNHYSAFEYILSKKKFAMADEMLKRGFDINSSGTYQFMSNDSRPAVSFVISHFDESYVDVLEFVLKQKPNLDITKENGNNLLLTAIINRDYKFAEMLFDAKISPLIANKEGINAVDQFIGNQAWNGFSSLRDKFVATLEVNTLDDLVKRETLKQNTELVTKLNALNLKKTATLRDIVYKCIELDHNDLVKLIVTNFDTFFETDLDKANVLFGCIHNKKFGIIEHFLSVGTKFNFKDGYCNTFFGRIVSTGNIDCVRTLLHKGCDVNEKSGNGMPLHNSIMLDFYDISELLLDNGADVTVKYACFGNAVDLAKIPTTPTRVTAARNKLVDRMEKMLASKKVEEKVEVKVEEKKTLQCVNHNGEMIEIPIEAINNKVKKIVIPAYWDKDFVWPVTTKSHYLTGGKTMHVRQLFNKIWTSGELRCPTDREYEILIPENVKPNCHVVPPGVWGGDTQYIVQFCDFSYA